MLFEDKNFIANIIKNYRIKNKLTQIQLAELIGLSEQHVSKLENAIYTPSLVTFLKIIKVLNIDIKDFGIDINEIDNKNKEELLKLILSATDKEIEFYYKNINHLKSTIAELKNTKQ